MYSSTHVEGDIVPECSRNPGKRKHVFFSSSTAIAVSPSPETNSPRSFREAFIKRRPSASSLNLNVTTVERSFPFSFELPLSCRAGEEMPPSFTGSMDPGPSSESIDVTYKVKVVWEAANASENPSVYVSKSSLGKLQILIFSSSQPGGSNIVPSRHRFPIHGCHPAESTILAGDASQI